MNGTQPKTQETATQLFARLITEKRQNTDPKGSTQLDPNLIKLENELMINKSINFDPAIFSKPISNKEIVEIYGRPNTGKSELLMHFMARFLLPPKWKIESTNPNESINNTQAKSDDFIVDLSQYSCLDTENVEVLNPAQLPNLIYINTDSKFSINRLFKIIEARLSKAYSSYLEQLEQANKLYQINILKTINVHRSMQKFARDCLKNLTCYQCFSNEEFLYSLMGVEHCLQTLIGNKAKIKSVIPIFIDSINSNFEIFDRYRSQLLPENSYDHTEKFTVQLVKKLLDKYNVCVVASRCDWTNSNLDGINNFASNEFAANSYKKWQGLVSKRVEMNRSLHKEVVGSESDETVKTSVRSCVKLLEILKSNTNVDPKAKVNEESRVVLDSTPYEIENSGFKLVFS